MVGTPKKTAGDGGEGGRSKVQRDGSLSEMLRERRMTHSCTSRKYTWKRQKQKKPKGKKPFDESWRRDNVWNKEIKTIQ